MAITNAQQYKQLLAKGGRTGFFLGGGGGADYSIGGGGNPNRSSTTSSSNREKGIMSRGGGEGGTTKSIKDFKETGPDRTAVDPGSKYRENVNIINQFSRTRPEVKIPPISVLSFFKKPIQKFSDFTTAKNRKFFQDVIRAGKIPGLNYETLSEMTENELEDTYQNYMANRLSGKTDAYGNPLNTGNDDGDPIIPLMAQAPEEPEEPEEPEVDPDSLEGLLANRIAYRFMADGGRAGFAEGGIMPRLNQLSGSVSSAEQMLQKINQRLQSAESSLGSGGGGALANMSNANFNTSNVNLNPGLASSVQTPDPFFGKGGGNQFINATLPKTLQLAGGATQQPAFGSMEEAYSSFQDKAKEIREGGMMGRVVLPGEMSFEDFSNQMNIKSGFFGMHGAGGVPAGGNSMQSPLSRAIGLRLGGRAGFAGGGMPYEGGIMDLESGRQMYFLGKLVKKATRAVKKIAKSPIGKAALAFGAYKFGPGIATFLKDKALDFGLYEAGKGLTNKGMLSLGAALTAAPLLFQEEEEEPDYASNRGPGLDIEAIRANPYNTMGSSYRFFAEGGDVEPVAKKTMPLLDMDGKEMDLRKDGGFVPIGRMERADDVPARLSKNEFVFTADAVRNAGDGDIDKGAEVMYNMMKNLESGGEVSEESQGLDGAREMFQTSKRLEEVL